MSIAVTCRCGRSFAAQPQLAGRQVACPACGQPLAVPRSATVPAAKPAASAPRPTAAERSLPAGLIVSCQCGQSFKAQPQLAGQRVACPACGRPLVVPAARPVPSRGGDPLDALEDPRLWNQMLMAEARSPAVARPPQPVQAKPKPKPRRRKRDPEDVRRMLGIAIGVVVALVVIVVAIVGIYSGKDLIASGGFGGWREVTSQSGGYRVSFPRGLGGKPSRDTRNMYGVTIHVEGQLYRNGDVIAVAHGDLPANAHFDWSAVERSLRMQGLEESREVHLGSYRGMEYGHAYQGKTRLARLYLVDNRFYELTWLSARSEKLTSSKVQKFFNSFRILGREDLTPTVASSSAPLPTGDSFASGVSSPQPALPENYSAARRGFRTKLLQRGPSPQEYDPLRTPRGAERITYRSGALPLTAFVDPAPAGGAGAKRPAVLFLHGGFAFGDDDWEMAEPYRQAGFVVMMPVLRGENGQPGDFTLYFDEVNDVLAAAEALGGLPYVDDAQVYVAGHSAGGSLAALAAMASDRFAAAASLSGCMDQRLNEELAPFDTADEREYRIRSPLDFAASFQCPVRLYYGSQEGWASASTHETARRAKAAGIEVEAVRVAGDHFTSVDPAIAQSIPFFRQHRRATAARPAPSQAVRPQASTGRVVVFQVLSFESRLDVLSAARNALRRVPWADLSRLEYAESTGTLTIGTIGSTIETDPAKKALEQAGFTLGRVSFRNEG